MSVTAASGPFVVFGAPQNTSGSAFWPNQYNPDAGPGLEFAMSGQLDNQVGYQPGQGPTKQIYGWSGTTLFVMDYAPATAATANISALANAVSGTPATLVSSNAAGIITAQSIVSRGNGQTITGLLAIDGPVGYVQFGTNQAMTIYDQRTVFGRAVSVTGVASGTGGNFIIRGYDYLGNPMQETIAAGAGVSTVNGKKSFKYIFSATPQFNDAHTYSVGTADIFGFPLRVDDFSQIDMAWAGSWITSSATGTFAFADVTNPATATSGDIRGTWASSSASNGSRVWAVYQTVPPYNMPGSPQVFIGSTTTSATTAIGNKTLTFSAVPSYVTVGTTLYNSTTTLSIPVGTTVTATTSTTITMSAGANIQVGNGDTIQFGQTSATAGVTGLPQFFTAQTVGGVTFG